jgi:hypothetical protein
MAGSAHLWFFGFESENQLYQSGKLTYKIGENGSIISETGLIVVQNSSEADPFFKAMNILALFIGLLGLIGLVGVKRNRV